MRIGEWDARQVGKLVTLRGGYLDTADTWVIKGYVTGISHTGAPRPDAEDRYVDPEMFTTEVTLAVGPGLAKVALVLDGWHDYS